MTFIIGPLDWPLGRSKGRAFLRESAFSLRESTNFYGTAAGRLFKVSIIDNLMNVSSREYVLAEIV